MSGGCDFDEVRKLVVGLKVKAHLCNAAFAGWDTALAKGVECTHYLLILHTKTVETNSLLCFWSSASLLGGIQTYLDSLFVVEFMGCGISKVTICAKINRD